MDDYFERLEEIIKNHEKEIDHLNAERMALRQEEDNMSFDSFNREYQRIIFHLENETRSLNAAQETLDRYHLNYEKSTKLIADIQDLRKLLENVTNKEDEFDISEEIKSKEEELQKLVANLPLELADYLRNREIGNDLSNEKEVQVENNELVNKNISSESQNTQDNKINEELPIFELQNQDLVNDNLEKNETNEIKPVPKEIDNVEKEQEDITSETIAKQSNVELNLSEEALVAYQEITKDIENIKNEQVENDRLIQETISRIQEIIKEEREKFENEGPFDTETLNRLQEYYMGLKISENEVFVELQRNKARLSRKLKSLEKKQQEIFEIDSVSMSFEISYKESEQLFRTLRNRRIINEIYEKKGLGEIIHKKGRTKEEKEILKKALEEIKVEIINYQKKNKNVNIKETINILYGMDKTVRKSSSKGKKELVLSEKDVENLKNNVKQLPAVIRKPNSKVVSNDKPLEAPKDIPNPLSEQLRLPDKQGKILGLPDKQGKILGLPDKQGKILGLPDKKQNILALPNKDDKLAQLPDKKEVIPSLPLPKDTDKNNDKKLTPIIPHQKDVEKPKEKEEITEEKHTLKRGLREIIGTLREGLEIGKKDGQRYRRSNLKISQNFKNELQSGNVLYNVVHVVPATIKAGIEFLGKISAKIMLGKEVKQMMQTLEERVDNLPYEDLETIYREYRGNRINQERYPQALNMVIEKKMSEYVLGKVTVLNDNIEKSYANVIYCQNLLKSIDDNLRKGKLSSEDKLKKLEQRKGVLQKAADSIKYIRTAKVDADNLLSGGLHGLSEDIKASTSKLNCIGMRFAKTYDLDNSLEDALMDCEKRENKAIYDGNDEELLKSFIESEVLLSKNTEISNSLFGKRSTGKKYYSPLAEQLDYRNDPFIRDLFTTIAVTTAALSATTSLKNQADTNNGIFKANEELVNKVHKAGEDITARRGAMYEGMRAQANQDVLTGAGTIERANLDSNGWAIGTDAYHAADHAGHEFYNGFYNDVQERIANVTKNYSGVTDQSQILQDLSQVASDSHATLVNVADKCLEIIKPYAQNNAQFDLSAFQDTMQFLVDHPDAIANMNQAMVDVQNIGEGLISLSESQLSMINSLPNNLGPSILSAAAACALATTVSNRMGSKRKEYGNNVTDMINEYAYNVEEDTSSKTI